MRKVIAFNLAIGLMLFSNAAYAIDANLTGSSNATVSGLGSNHAIVSTVNQNGAVATTDWTRFNINSGETVTNRFNGTNQNLLFRVIGDPTKINGVWNTDGIGAATGKTTLINPAGIMVGNGSVINLASLTMTTVNPLTNKINAAIDIKDGAKITTKDSLNLIANNISVGGGSALSSSTGSIKLVTADGVHFDVLPGGKITNVQFENANNPATGNIVVANSSLKAPNGSVYIVANRNVILENFDNTPNKDIVIRSKNGDITASNFSSNGSNIVIQNSNSSGAVNLRQISIKGGKTDISSVDGNINIDAGLDSAGKLDMSKRSNFDGAKVNIASANGKIHVENLDNKNGSHLSVVNQNGLIENANNTNTNKSIYAMVNQNGEIISNNFTNDDSQYTAQNQLGKIALTNIENKNNSYTGAYSNTGEVNITGFNNKNKSILNVESPDHDNLTPPGYVKPSGSQLNIANSTNDATSSMTFYNDKGHINLNNVDSSGTLAFSANDGSVNITNGSNIKGTIKKSKAAQFNFTDSKIDDTATIEELDGGVYFGNVTSNGTVDLNNKNGNVLIVGSNFAKDLNVNSDRDIEISTSKAQNMNANGRDVTIHDLTAETLANNIVASRDALLEGTAVKFKSVNAGRDAELRGDQILTPPTGADINAARVATVATKTQNITLNKVEGKTLYTTFAPNNEVRITDGQKIVLETSGANSMAFATTIDDTANNREFELRAGQFDYAPKTVALKTDIITLDGKRSDLNVKDGVSSVDTIDINAFDSKNLNIKTSNGNVYVYHPITRDGITYEAKKPTTDVYHIWPSDDNDLMDNQEINKIKEVSNDLAGLAPSPVTSFMPLGASAEIEEINKKYFVETTEQQYQVLENLPVGMKDMTPKKREIY